MSADAPRQFIGGNRNPDLYGLSLRWSAGARPSAEEIDAAARWLGRPAFFVDEQGCECELFAAAIDPDSQQVAYVQSRSRLVQRQLGGNYLDVTIKVHLADPQRDRSADIETYNPFFGCDVRYLRWHGPHVLLIYQEKHDTYACRFGDNWPPVFAKIDEAWLIHDGVIHFVGYQPQAVLRRDAESLERLPDMSLDEAAAAGVFPTK